MREWIPSKEPFGLILCLLVVCSLAVAPASASHGSGDVVVDPNDQTNPNTIQQGISHANNGDTIVVKSGEYTPSTTIVVDKSVTIVADGDVVVNGQYQSANAFRVDNGTPSLADVAITDFTIQNYTQGSGSASTGHGVAISDTDVTNVTVRNNTFENLEGSAVTVFNSGTQTDRVAIQNNTVQNVSTGIRITGTGSADLTNITVVNNTFYQPVDQIGITVNAIDSSSMTNVSVVGNNASAIDSGLDVAASDTGNITDLRVALNDFEDVTTGVNINAGRTASSDAVVDNVTIAYNALNRSTAGVSAQADGTSTLSGLNISRANNFSDSTLGVGIQSDNESTISDIGIDNATLENTNRGVELIATNQSEIRNTALENSSVNRTSYGFTIASRNDADIENVSAENATFARAANQGVSIDAVNDSTVDNVTIANSLGDFSDIGFIVCGSQSATIRDVEVHRTFFNNSGTYGVLVSGDNQSSISDLNLTEVGLNDSATGYYMDATGTATVSSVRLDRLNLSNSNTAGDVDLVDSGTISDVYVTNAIAEDSDSGFLVTAGSTSSAATTLDNVTFYENGFNQTSGTGFSLDADGSSSLTDVRLERNSLENNDRAGQITLRSSASLTDFYATQTLVEGSNEGFLVTAGSTGSAATTLDNATFYENGFNGTSATGFTLATDGSSSLTDVRLERNSLENNDRAGQITLRSDASLTDFYATQTLIDGSNTGFELSAGSAQTAATTLDNVTFYENGFNETSGAGFTLEAEGSSTLSDLEFNRTSIENAAIGARIELSHTAELNDSSMYQSLASGSDDGLLVTTRNESLLRNVSFVENGFNETTDPNTAVGAELIALDNSTIEDVDFQTSIFSDNDVGLRTGAHDNATLQNMSLEETLAENNTDNGFVIQSGVKNDASATVDNVTLTTGGANESGSSGLLLFANGTSQLANVTAEEVVTESNSIGVSVLATNASTIDSINVRNALIRNNTEDGIYIDVESGASHGQIGFSRTLLANNTDAGLQVTGSTAGDGIAVHRSFITGNDRGVVNDNGSSVVDARFNWWGNSTGPSSPASVSDPLEDPVADAEANGTGDSVSEGSTSGVSNVRFAPGIGGQTRSGDQLIDPIEEFASDRRLNVTIAGQTIEGPLSDFVGLTVWERSVLPFRTDPATAETSVRLPNTFVRDPNEGDVSINRENVSVYGTDEAVTLDFQKVTGADTTRYQNAQAQLVILRGTENQTNMTEIMDPESSINRTTGNVSIASNATEVVEIRDVQLDGSGEFDTDFTPQRSGDYVAILATNHFGPGFVRNDSGLAYNALNSSSTIVGVEGIVVQTVPSSVSLNRTQVNPGGTISVTADANFSASSVNHVVLAYNRTEFTDQTVIINSSDVINDTSTGTLITINGTADGEAFTIEANVSDGDLTDVNVSGAITDVNHSVEIIERGGTTETVSLTLGDQLSLGANDVVPYRLVHAAIDDDNTTRRSTNADSVDVVGSGVTAQPNATVNTSTLSFGRVRVRNSETRTVELLNDGSAPLSVGSLDIVGPDSGVFDIQSESVGSQLAPNERGEITVRFHPQNRGQRTATLDISTNDSSTPTLEVDLEGRGRPRSTGGGGGGGDDDTSTVVVGTSRSANVSVTNVEPGVPVNVSLGGSAVADGTGVTDFTVRANRAGDFQVNVTQPRQSPTEGAPGLSHLSPGRTADPVRYLSISARGVSDDDIDSVVYRFRVQRDALPTGTDPEDVAMFRYTDGSWSELETTYRGNNVYTATSPGFSSYAIGVVQVEPASFTVTDATVADTSLTENEETTVTATVENTGGEDGTFVANLTVDGDTVQQETVDVPGTETRTVSFTLGFDEPGTYDVGVSGTAAGTVEVSPVTTTTVTDTETTEPTETTETPETGTEPEETTTAPTGETTTEPGAETPPGSGDGTTLIFASFILLILLIAGGAFLYEEGYLDEYLSEDFDPLDWYRERR